MKRKMLFPLIVLFLVSLACNLTNQATQVKSIDLTATAQSDVQTAQFATQQTQLPTVTPIPVETITPTPEVLPSMSPAESGQIWAVFTDPSRNIWIWQDGGSARQLTRGGDAGRALLSDDGNLIAFTRRVSSLETSLWVMKMDGTQQRELISAEKLMQFSIDWSSMGEQKSIGIVFDQVEWIPGTHTLAFSTRTIFDAPGTVYNYNIILVDADKGARKILLNAGQAGKFTYSPDGNQIALARPDQISLINADGSNLREAVLTFEPVLTYTEAVFHPELRWSAGSTYLRVVIPPPDPADLPLEWTKIFEIPIDGSPAYELSSLPIAPFASYGLSPDLEKIAYARAVGKRIENNLTISVIQVDGKNEVNYSTGDYFYVNWSPDSQAIVFQKFSPMLTYLGDNKGNTVNLTDVDPASQITWIDKTRFLFYYHATRQNQIRLGIASGPSQVIAELPKREDGASPMFDVVLLP